MSDIIKFKYLPSQKNKYNQTCVNNHNSQPEPRPTEKITNVFLGPIALCTGIDVMFVPDPVRCTV